MGCIFRARYYPNQSFSEAVLGHRSSATWRGINQAREFLLKGITKRVCSRLSVLVWDDPWIIVDENFRTLTTRPLGDSFTRLVSELIISWRSNMESGNLGINGLECRRHENSENSAGGPNSNDKIVRHYEKKRWIYSSQLLPLDPLRQFAGFGILLSVAK